jgi:hypothetical protein
MESMTSSAQGGVAARIHAEQRTPRGTRARARKNLVERVRKAQARLRSAGASAPRG